MHNTFTWAPTSVPLALSPAHLCWRRSTLSLSRARRCRMHTSFCCSGVRYCSGGGALIPWLSLQPECFAWRLGGRSGTYKIYSWDSLAH